VDAGLRLARRAARRAVGRGRLAAAVVTARRAGTPPQATPDEVALVPVEAGQLDVLANLVQLYRHDMADFRGYQLTEAGTYEYPYLDRCVSEPDREAWFIRVGGRLAGFVLTAQRPDGVWQISEHFVARSWRGRGVGRIALAKTFALHEGGWTCFVDDDNGTSRRMCTGAVGDVGAEGARTSRGVSGNGFAGTVFRFAVPGGGDAAEEPGPATCC
jgi:predicted acetyltransferase